MALVGEAGLIGLLLDRDFERTRWMYLYYSTPGDSARGRDGEMRPSRVTLAAPRDSGERIDPSSEVVVMRWPYQVAAHMGGGMAWDAAGNLYLAVGENSDPTQYNPVHWTNPGGREQDSQRTAANSNDFRGKKPNAWGLYDTLGNVWEWVEDVYDGRPFPGPAAPPRAGAGATTHVLRGGSFTSDVKNATWSTHAGGPGNGWDVGFRVVREPVQR